MTATPKTPTTHDAPLPTTPPVGLHDESLAARHAEVLERVAAAARQAGRKPADVILIAVTKNADPEQIKTLLALGHRDFGENRVQQLAQHAAIVEEFLARQRLLPGTRRLNTDAAAESLFPAAPEVELKPVAGQPGAREGVRWHMIGHLQRNKARKVIEFVRLTHSVDSLRLAEELQQIALRRDQPVEVLLQVNCSGEGAKYGCPMPAAIPLAEQIATMINVRLRGLMTIAPYGERPEDARATFVRCRELFEEMSTMGFGESAPFNILSMGMSGDYEVAISEGANLVRVGSSIFGESRPEETDPPEAPEPDAPADDR